MIIRLSLKTEHPERILSFLETYDYLRVLPIRLAENATGEDARQLLEASRKYRELLRLPETKITNGRRTVQRQLTAEEKAWFCGQIRNAFAQYTADPLEREQFSVELVDACYGDWEKGNCFFVFPSSYASVPVLQF